MAKQRKKNPAAGRRKVALKTPAPKVKKTVSPKLPRSRNEALETFEISQSESDWPF